MPLSKQLSQIPLGCGQEVAYKHLTTYNKFTPSHTAPLQWISRESTNTLSSQEFSVKPRYKKKKILNVWWEIKPPGHIRTLKMSTAAKQSWVQKCSCVHPALDGLVSFFYLTRAISVCASAQVHGMQMQARVFLSAEPSTARCMMHKLLYLICYLFLLPPHNFTLLCISPAHFDLTVSPILISFVHLPTPLYPSFLLITLFQWVQYVLSISLSISSVL